MDKENHSHSKRIGARIFSEANDLKRTPEALAIDLNWELADIIKVISGEADTKMGTKLLFEMATHYPISLRDIWVETDDTDDGVIVVSGDQSAATSRIFNRLNQKGELTPYYEYRDTAMSRLAPYRPEWIRELRYVADSNPENPDVAFNTEVQEILASSFNFNETEYHLVQILDEEIELHHLDDAFAHAKNGWV